MQHLTQDADPKLAWSRLTRRQRRDPVLQAAHARALINTGAKDVAERFLRKSIARHWNGELVRLYGHAHSKQIEEQLRRAEQWSGSHKDDPDLLMTLARLHLEHNDRDKARDHLLEAVRLGGSREGYLELGLLLESMGESDKALQCYRRGLQSPEVAGQKTIASEVSTPPAELVPVLESPASR